MSEKANSVLGYRGGSLGGVAQQKGKEKIKKNTSNRVDFDFDDAAA